MKRYILRNEEWVQEDYDNYSQMARALGCSRAHISYQLKQNISWFKINNKRYNVIDRLSYEYQQITRLI